MKVGDREIIDPAKLESSKGVVTGEATFWNGKMEWESIERIDARAERERTMDPVALRVSRLLPQLRRLDFVRWDRFCGTKKSVDVFGWIGRPDGKCDFVLIQDDDKFTKFCTSSAEYSQEISYRLFGKNDRDSHNKCRRIEEVLPPEDLPNVIRLQTTFQHEPDHVR